VKKTLAMTIYNRTPEVVGAVFNGLSLPGNQVDEIAVCFDRAPDSIVEEVHRQCEMIKTPLAFSRLTDNYEGPRCPSLAWNTAIGLVKSSHVFCISSDVVLGPHSIGMAYQIAKAHDNAIVCGQAIHCGPSYSWERVFDNGMRVKDRIMTYSKSPQPLGFNWLLPTNSIHKIGGYDLAYMGGYCYEDDDFVIRMWRSGVDIIFCDDVLGIHLEHKREHLKNSDGRVTANEKVFVGRYGDIDYLRERKFKVWAWAGHAIPGLSIWAHGPSNHNLGKIADAIYEYGKGEEWRAAYGEKTADVP